MNNIWYLSPSNQTANIGIDGYGTEKEQMCRLVDEIVPHLDRAGVSFHVADPDMAIGQRATESNAMGAKFHLCFHSNAGGNGKAWGPVALYYSAGGKQLGESSWGKAAGGKQLGEQLVAALLDLGQKNNRCSNLVQRKDLLELKKTAATACLLEVDFHDSSVGVEFLTRRRSKIAQALAKAIIEADGKQFVPVNPGEYTDRAVALGLFPRNTNWNTSLSKEDAAALAVRLYNLLNRG